VTRLVAALLRRARRVARWWPGPGAGRAASALKHHRDRLARHLSGTGIEIGALHNPMPVDRARASVRYVDRLSLDEQRRHYPELGARVTIEPDIVAEAHRLSPLDDASQDFVIANHLLEHLTDPIGALAEWYRVLKPGGVLFLALPDKRLTFDRDRPRTTLAHLIADHRDGGEASRVDHYLEYVRLVDHVAADAAAAHAEQLMARRYAIHFHVWIPEDIRQLLGYLTGALGQRWEVLEHLDSTASDEFIYVLRKPPLEARPR
jgi:SAM-dependent methyltransferase